VSFDFSQLTAVQVALLAAFATLVAAIVAAITAVLTASINAWSADRVARKTRQREYRLAQFEAYLVVLDADTLLLSREQDSFYDRRSSLKMLVFRHIVRGLFAKLNYHTTPSAESLIRQDKALRRAEMDYHNQRVMLREELKSVDQLLDAHDPDASVGESDPNFVLSKQFSQGVQLTINSGIRLRVAVERFIFR
jgi:hypothetical protein